MLIMNQELERETQARAGERIRVILPANMADPKDNVVEGAVNGEAFAVTRGVAVMLTPAQYEVLRASGRVDIY